MREIPSACGEQQRDLLCSGTKMFLFWCLPSFAFALGFFVSPGLRTVLWTLSLGFMGTLCLLNASRCGRIHCYFTGPFFILGAVTWLGYVIGLLPFGPSGWKWIGNITIIGAIVLSSIPELVLGRYRRNRPGLIKKYETNFWGSFVFTGTALYFQSTSRTLGGYTVFGLSAIPALGLSYL